MEIQDLIKKLRELSYRTASPYKCGLIKMAAQRLGKLEQELKEKTAQLAKVTAALQRSDMDCEYCAHKTTEPPCLSDESHYLCDECPHKCYCKDCVDNSKYAFSGSKGAGTT